LKRTLLLTNLALLLLCGWIGLRLRQHLTDDDTREQAVLQQQIKPIPAPPLAPPRTAEPLRPAGYIDIAQKMLFSKDRNPTVVVEAAPPPPPKPMPPLPVFHGMMNLGDGAFAILSEKPGGPHRDFRPGEAVGEFKLVAINNEEITLEWDGKTITRKVEEILDRGAPPAAGAPNVSPGTQARKIEPVHNAPAAPGMDLSDRGIRLCQAGDDSPAGTVTDGMRKVIKESPFGKNCYWEPAK
jgi:hypothetical protein